MRDLVVIAVGGCLPQIPSAMMNRAVSSQRAAPTIKKIA